MPPSPGNDQTPEWEFGGGSGTYECKLDRGATPIDGWAACTTPYGYDLSAESDGTYTFAVRTRDAAGNQSKATVTFTIR